MQRVIIVGGGTGGTMLANALDPRRFHVTLVSASLEHVFQPELLYVAFKGASSRIGRGERGLLRPSVRIVPERAVSIDLERRCVVATDGIERDYDRLVVATGMATDPSGIPGLEAVNAEFGDYHSTVAQARKLWEHVDAFAGGTVVLGQTMPICKCPPSPVEGMLLLDALLRRRGVRERSKLAFFTPYPRAYPAQAIDATVAALFAERGIAVSTFFDAAAVDAGARTVTSIEGDTLHYDLPILIPPFVGAPIAYSPAAVVDENRFLIVDKEKLNVKGFDDAFAIGDATNAPTAKSGVTAHLQANVVAKRLNGKDAVFDGRTNCPMDLGDGRGLFVIGSYTAPVIPYRPNRISRRMKEIMARIYWLSLRGMLEPIFGRYFAVTDPARHAARQK